jgi:hypothetical protein
MVDKTSAVFERVLETVRMVPLVAPGRQVVGSGIPGLSIHSGILECRKFWLLPCQPMPDSRTSKYYVDV